MNTRTRVTCVDFVCVCVRVLNVDVCGSAVNGFLCWLLISNISTYDRYAQAVEQKIVARTHCVTLTASVVAREHKNWSQRRLVPASTPARASSGVCVCVRAARTTDGVARSALFQSRKN